MPTASVTQLKPTRASAILLDCQKLSETRLPEALKHVLNQADDALFDLANKADSSQRQNHYFDAMRELRLKRDEFESSFANYLEQQFSTSQSTTSRGTTMEQLESNGELCLVDIDDVEQSLAVTNFAESIRSRSREELFALDKRLGVLMGIATMDDEDNPVGPKAIGEALRSACQVLESDVEIKLTLLKLFDKYAGPLVHHLYCDLNKLLVAADVLPEIKAGAGQTAPSRKRTRVIIESEQDSVEASGEDVFSTLEQLMHGAHPSSSTTGSGPAPLGGLGGSLPPMTMRATGTPSARSAVSGQTISGGFSGGGISAGGMSSVAGEALTGAPLVHGLTELQRGQVVNSSVFRSIDHNAVVAGDVNVLHALREGGSFAGAEPAEHLTLEIVSLLFDYILDDPAIPDALKALIGRLQIPVLKVALLDREVFSKKQHPARRLLDELAKASIGWSEGLRQQDELYDKVESVVHTVVTEFVDDVVVFERVLESFIDFVQTEADAAAERAAASQHSLHTKEQIIRAKMEVDDEIRARLGAHDIREFIRNFVLDYWRQLLIVTTIEVGRDDDKWKAQFATLDELIWSAQAKTSIADRKELMKRLPTLVKALKAGMQELDMPAADRSRFLSMLASVHVASVRSDEEISVAEQRLAEAQARINARRAAADAKLAARRQGVGDAVDFAVDEPEVLINTAHKAAEKDTSSDLDQEPARTYEDPANEEFIKKGLERIFEQKETGPVELDIDFSVFGEAEPEQTAEEDLTVDGSLAPVHESDLVEYSDQVMTLDLGDWLELVADDGTESRVRFTWISPDTGRYLFTTRGGEKALDTTMVELALMLRDNKAKIIKAEPDPLFERALGALIEQFEGAASTA